MRNVVGTDQPTGDPTRTFVPPVSLPRMAALYARTSVPAESRHRPPHTVSA